jgi:hypothetical protein
VSDNALPAINMLMAGSALSLTNRILKTSTNGLRMKCLFQYLLSF